MGRKITPEMDPQEQRVLRDVEEYGVHVKFISEEKGLPGWAFSIGLFQRYQHPEILIFGLPSEVMHRLINNIAEDLNNGKRYYAGFESSEIIEGYKCIFHTVDGSWYPPFLGWATWFYEGEDFPVLQCIWPDKEQNYPWSVKYSENLRTHQPCLFRWGVEEARVECFLRSMYDSTLVDEMKEITALRQTADSLTSGCKTHKYVPTTWPFDNPKRINVLTTQEIINGSLPIGAVFHDESDVWVVYPRLPVEIADKPVEACLGCLYERDSTLADIADLPRGWVVRKEFHDAPWNRKLMPVEES